MKEAQVDRKEFTQLTETIEQVTSIAKATKFGLSTSYVKGLSDEEVANVFDGIVELLEPVKDMLYTINEEIDFKSEKKVVIK